MNTSKLVIGGVVIALILGIVGASKHNTTTVINDKGEPVTLGSVSGPESFFPVESHNGIQYAYNRTAMQQATTTVCAIKSPSATSTLSYMTAHIDIATSSVSEIVFAKATTAFATTTLVGKSTVVGALEFNIASSTNSVGNYTIFAPNTFLNVSRSGGSIGSTFSESGNCQAEFLILTK